MEKRENLALALLWAAAAAAMFVRCFYAVETTDETFYVAEAMMVANGRTPYLDMWFQSAGFAVLLAPFLKLFTVLTGGTEGIFLFARLVSTALRLVFSLLLAQVLKKVCGTWAAQLMAICLVLVPYAWVSSYNTQYVRYVALSGACLLRGALCGEEERRACRGWFAAAGASLALAAYAYSTGIFLCAAVMLALAGTDALRRRKGCVRCVWLAAGGGAVFAAVMVYSLLLHGYSVGQLVESMRMVLSGPYMGIEQTPAAEKLKGLLLLATRKRLLLPALAFVLAPALLRRLASEGAGRRLSEQTAQRLIRVCVILLLVWTAVGYLRAARAAAASAWLPYSGFWDAFWFPLLYLPYIRTKRREARAAAVCVWLPVAGSFLAAGMTAYDGHYSRTYMLLFAALLAIPFCQWAIEDAGVHGKRPAAAAMAAALCLAGMLACGDYFFVFRDVPIAQMDARVERGVYKGVWTSAHRAEQMVVLEDLIRSHTSAGEGVLGIGGWNAGAYLMTEGENVAPNSWQPVMSDYYIGDAEQLDAILKLRGKQVDKIIFYCSLDVDKVDFSLLENEDYPLTPVIREQYHLICESTEYGFGLRIYARNEG